jgi:HPt (histidine-containing phosphotransfer) domain-containing protein
MLTPQNDNAEATAEKTMISPSFLSLSTLELQTVQDLRAMIDDDLAFSDLITVYVSSAEILIDQIQKAFADNDADELRIAAHSLKSTSASIGGTKLSEICKFIEQTSRQGIVAITREFISDTLVQEYDLLIIEIKSYIIDNMSGP